MIRIFFVLQIILGERTDNDFRKFFDMCKHEGHLYFSGVCVICGYVDERNIVNLKTYFEESDENDTYYDGKILSFENK